MANNDVTLTVGANLSPAQRQLQAFIQQSQRQLGSQSFQFKLNEKGFRQPLGRITGDLNQFQGAMDASIARTLAFGASVGAIAGVTKAFKDLVAVSVKVEHSLKEINVLLNLSTKDLQGFSKELFGVAKNTASSFDTVTKAATEFSRQGLGAAETAKRVNSALILTRLSGLDAEASVSALTAAVNGFRREAVSTTEVVNRLANVDAAFAVSSADLAKALSRAGSVSQDAKVKFNELLAATTAVQQATARGGNVIGNGFKTIFTRLQRSKVRSELEKIGVATTDATGNIRGAIDVLKDYARVYKTLSDQQKAYTSEQVAGVFQINTLKALINDLSNEYGVYNRALAVANNTTNEAVQRNAELNKTLQSLASQTGTEIAELASKVGAISFEGNFKGILGFIKSALGDVNKTIDSEGIGGTLARGVLQGFGDFITGPGMAVALVGITRLLFFIGKQTKTALLQVFQIGTASQKRQIVQQRINALLAEDNNLLRQIMSSSGNINDIQKIVVRNINQQNAALTNQKLLISQIAAGFQLTGGGSIAPIGGSTKGPSKRGADGFIPNMVRGERASISQGVGGARAGDRPVVIPNFSFGGGKSGTMVAHTGEHIVPNFAGGGSAIFNREMVSSMGLPSGARRVAATGFVPNFVTEDEDFVYSIQDASDGDSVTGDVRIRRNIGNRLANVDAAETNQAFGSAATTVAQDFYKAQEAGKGPADKNANRLQKTLMGGKFGAYGRITFKDEVLANQLVGKGFGVPDYRFAKKGEYSNELTKARGYPDKEGVPTKTPMGMWKEGYEKHPKRIMVEEALGLIAQRKKSKIRAHKGARDAFDPFDEVKKKKAAGGFIPNFVNYPDPRNPGKKVSRRRLDLLRKDKEISERDFNASMDSVSGKNEADAIYRTNQIVALVSNNMGQKKAFEFATGTKDAVGFTATGTKSLSVDGPQQVEQIIAPAIYAAADEVFRRMTNQEPAGGITNIPDGLKKMAGSVFEAAAQKVVGTTQFKGNQNLDMPVVTGANKELLEKAFNIKGLAAMDAAEIKLGYNKALMQDVATKIIRSKRASRGQGGPIAKFHGSSAEGYIPSFANLASVASSPAGKRAMATERALTGSARMGYDSRVGYGVFNNSQGSLGNAVSQHLNSGDSAGSLASAGEAAQAAVAAAAAGFVPSLASPFPVGSPQGPYKTPKVVIDPASSKKTAKDLGDGVKKGGKKTESGLAKVMAISFVAQAAAGSIAQTFAKREDFESKQAAETISGVTQGAAAGASIGSMIPIPGGAAIGGAIGAIAALAPILDSTGQALKKLQFEVQKSAEAYAKNQSAVANYIDTLAQYQTETEPTKRVDLAEQMGASLNLMSSELASKLVVIGKSNLIGAKEIAAVLATERKDVTIGEARDLAAASEATANAPGRRWWEQVLSVAAPPVGEALYEARTGATRTDRQGSMVDKAFLGGWEKMGSMALGFTSEAMGAIGDRGGAAFVGRGEKFLEEGGLQQMSNDNIQTMRMWMTTLPKWMQLDKIPGAFDREKFEEDDTRMKVREARETIGRGLAFEEGPLERGADETKAEALARGKELVNLGQIIKDASMGDLANLKKEKDLTVGDVFKKLGMEGDEIPKQLRGQLETLMIDAAHNFDDAASREIIQILGEAADKVGKQTEEAFDPDKVKKRWIAMANAAAEEFEAKIASMTLDASQIFASVARAEQRNVTVNAATAKFQDQLGKVGIAAVGDFGVDGDKRKQTKADRVAEIEREAITRGQEIADDKQKVKFLGEIAKSVGDEENKDELEELMKIQTALSENRSAQDIFNDKSLNVQGQAREDLKDQVLALKAIETAAGRQTEILTLNGLRQEALLEEARREKVREEFQKAAPTLRKDSHKLTAAIDAVARFGEGRGAAGGGDLRWEEGMVDALSFVDKTIGGMLGEDYRKKELTEPLKERKEFLAIQTLLSAMPNVLGDIRDLRGETGEGEFKSAKEMVQAALITLKQAKEQGVEGSVFKRIFEGSRVSPEAQEKNFGFILNALENLDSAMGENKQKEAFKKAFMEANKAAMSAKGREALTGADRMGINAQMGVVNLENQMKLEVTRIDKTRKLIFAAEELLGKGDPEASEKMKVDLIAALKQVPGMTDEFIKEAEGKSLPELIADMEILVKGQQERRTEIEATLKELAANKDNVKKNTKALEDLSTVLAALSKTTVKKLLGEPGDESNARGFVPSMARGGMGMGAALARERRAIAMGVGGAIPGVDRPRLITLNNRKAAVNTGEKLVPNYNGTGQTAVLTRDMQGSMGAPGAAGTRGVIGGGEAVLSGLEGSYGVASKQRTNQPLTSAQRLTGRGLVPRAVTKVGMGARIGGVAKNFLRPGPLGLSMMAIDAMRRMAPDQREAPRDPRTGRQISQISPTRGSRIPFRRSNRASGYIPNMAVGDTVFDAIGNEIIQVENHILHGSPAWDAMSEDERNALIGGSRVVFPEQSYDLDPAAPAGGETRDYAAEGAEALKRSKDAAARNRRKAEEDLEKMRAMRLGTQFGNRSTQFGNRSTQFGKGRRLSSESSPSQFGNRRSAFNNAEGYIPNLSLGSQMVPNMNASNHFLNFAEGSAPAAAASTPAPTSLVGGQTPGETLITQAKSSQEKHNVNVNIEVYGNLSQDQVDQVQANGSDMATVLEGLVNGGL